jgi:hypothetical protein
VCCNLFIDLDFYATPLVVKISKMLAVQALKEKSWMQKYKLELNA